MLKMTFGWSGRSQETVLKAYDKGIPRAVVSALNKTIKGLKTDVERKAMTIYNIKKKELKKYSGVFKASKGKMSARLQYKYRRRTWRFYGATVMRKKKKNAGLRARVYKKDAKFQHSRGFFMERNGILFTLFREDKTTIKRLTGPSIPQIMSNREVQKVRKASVRDRYKKNYESQLQRLAAKIK